MYDDVPQIIVPLFNVTDTERVFDKCCARRYGIDNFLEDYFCFFGVAREDVYDICAETATGDVDSLDLLIMYSDYGTTEATQFCRTQCKALNHTGQIHEWFNLDEVTNVKPAFYDHSGTSGDITQNHTEGLAGKNNEERTGTDSCQSAA